MARIRNEKNLRAWGITSETIEDVCKNDTWDCGKETKRKRWWDTMFWETQLDAQEKVKNLSIEN